MRPAGDWIRLPRVTMATQIAVAYTPWDCVGLPNPHFEDCSLEQGL